MQKRTVSHPNDIMNSILVWDILSRNLLEIKIKLPSLPTSSALVAMGMSDWDLLHQKLNSNVSRNKDMKWWWRVIRPQQNLDTCLIFYHFTDYLFNLTSQTSWRKKKKTPWLQLQTILCPLSDAGPEVQFYLLYNSWNCLGLNALQRLIHKINWPEIHWSRRQSVSPFICLTLSPALMCKHSHRHTLTYTHIPSCPRVLPCYLGLQYTQAIRKGEKNTFASVCVAEVQPRAY